MTEDQKNIREKVDIHFGKTDFSIIKNYVEFSFYACFLEVFNIEDSYWESDLKGNKLFEILKFLNISIEINLLKQKYLDQNNHDVEVFHSAQDELTFAYIDLKKDPTDQNDMFFLGISCSNSQEKRVHEKLLEIYQKLQPASPFEYDILNHALYLKSFKSYFYFYKSNYDKCNRKMNHY